MCLHPLNSDVLECETVDTPYCTFTDDCDYLSTENRLLIEDDDLAIVQLNIRGSVWKA